MDAPSSIITQVNQNGEQVVVNPDHVDKVGTTTHSKENTKQYVVKRKRRFLGNFLCCVGLRKQKNVSVNHPSGDALKVSDDDGSVNGVSAVRVITAVSPSDTGIQENGDVPPELNHNHVQRPGNNYLLPQTHPSDTGKKCIVIDLDETLVHSSFKPVENADFIVPVEIDGTVHQVYVLKRPHVDQYLQRLGELYECVLFTASLAKYADPVADLLDKWGCFRTRLFRESCVFHKGNYVKDLSKLGREPSQILIVDNSPASYIFHPDNAVPVTSWFDDPNDRELLDMVPLLENLSKEKEIYTLLKSHCQSVNPSMMAHP